MPGSEIPEELAVQADTPRALAQKLGIDPDGLERTLREFNAAAARGEDPAFGTGHYPWAQRLVGDMSYPNPNLGVVEKPPFYGVRLVPVGVGINSHGLRTDVHGRVVHLRGHAIPGLYAVGISAALLDLGGGYQSGTSNMRAITWGYVAGRHCRRARAKPGAVKFLCGFVWIDATHYLPLARTADACGWDGVVLSDHLVHVEKIASRYPYHESGERPWQASDPYPDVWVSIGAMAAVTAAPALLPGRPHRAAARSVLAGQGDRHRGACSRATASRSASASAGCARSSSWSARTSTTAPSAPKSCSR